MTTQGALRASLNNLTSERGNILLSMAGITRARNSTGVRMQRVNSLRAAIAKGDYSVSSSDLADKLFNYLAEGFSLQSRNDSGSFRLSSHAGSLPTHGSHHATFQSSRASDSAEEVNDERVGKVEGNRRT